MGLMAIGPASGDERANRQCFRQVAELMSRLPERQAQVLSLGMSGDFEPAIEEGSTMVRVGTAIFGPRGSG